MSIIWDLKKIDLNKNLENNRLFKFRNRGIFYLTKSHSFNKIKSGKTPSINNKYKLLFTNNSNDKLRKNEKQLKEKNTKLKIQLNNIYNELILAKSAGNKKNNKLHQNNKLLINAINIKKLTLDLDNKSSSNFYNIKTEENLTIKGFKSNLIYKIKKQYLDLENENKNKKNFISDLKNNINNCNNKEVLNKNKKLMNKFKALKTMYDINLEKNNENKLKMKEFIELEDKLSKKNFYILEMKESLNDINEKKIGLENDIEKLKKKLKTLETENEKLNNEYLYLNEKYNQASKEKNEVENKLSILIGENNEKTKNL